MKWNETATAKSNAYEQLPRMMEKYFKAGRQAVRGRKTPTELHRFRVRTKRLRYALEMFTPVYGEELANRLGVLQQLQKLLGKISDTYTIRQLLKRDGSFKKDLQADERKHIEEFRDYWKTTFDAPHELERWTSALGAPPVSIQ